MAETFSVQADKIVVEKDHKRILNELSFTIPSGSVTGLIGPSGSGKTTLMRSIVGVQVIKSGSLKILNEKVGSVRLRKKLGYVTQSPAIYGDLTIEQNLRYFGVLVGARKAQINNVIEQVQLDAQRHNLVKNLSGGQQARVSLGIALLGDPQLLVLDEPTVGLDPLLRRDLWALFRDLAAQGKTLLVSSHVMDEAEKCTQLLLMRNGELLWKDTRESLLQKTKASSVEVAFIEMVTAKGVK